MPLRQVVVTVACCNVESLLLKHGDERVFTQARNPLLMNMCFPIRFKGDGLLEPFHVRVEVGKLPLNVKRDVAAGHILLAHHVVLSITEIQKVKNKEPPCFQVSPCLF